VELRNPEVGVPSGGDALTGSVTLALQKDAFFILTARNDRGVRETAARAVVVEDDATDVLLIASPAKVTAGEKVVLAWSAPGAHDVTLTPEGGQPLDLAGQTDFGTVQVAPLSSTCRSRRASCCGSPGRPPAPPGSR
jgi:hypothetical protein